jgi:hypothetical protein
MSSDQPNNSSSSPPAGGGGRRRSSFVDLFGPRAPASGQNANGQPSRRLSITTLGLSTLQGSQSSPFGTARTRAESVSSANSGSVDESPFEDEPGALPTSSVPTSPFARRMSFGAKAMRDMRSSANGNPNGRASVSSTTSAPTSTSSPASAAAAAVASSVSTTSAKSGTTPPTLKSRGLSCLLLAQEKLPSAGGCFLRRQRRRQCQKETGLRYVSSSAISFLSVLIRSSSRFLFPVSMC